MEFEQAAHVGLEDLASYLGMEPSMVEEWLTSGQLLEYAQRNQGGKWEFSILDMRKLRTHHVVDTIRSLIVDPEEWLDMPNPWMGGDSPRELLGTDREQLVIDVIEGIKYGAVA
jgi:hypothetical protein